jgi:hypothetical protein
MILAFGTDREVFLEGLIVNDMLTAGAFGPKALGHSLFLFGRNRRYAFAGGLLVFFEDGHDYGTYVISRSCKLKNYSGISASCQTTFLLVVTPFFDRGSKK